MSGVQTLAIYTGIREHIAWLFLGLSVVIVHIREKFTASNIDPALLYLYTIGAIYVYHMR